MKTLIEMPTLEHDGVFRIDCPSLSKSGAVEFRCAWRTSCELLIRNLIKEAVTAFSGHEVTVTFEPFFAECKRIEYKAKLP